MLTEKGKERERWRMRRRCCEMLPLDIAVLSSLQQQIPRRTRTDQANTAVNTSTDGTSWNPWVTKKEDMEWEGRCFRSSGGSERRELGVDIWLHVCNLIDCMYCLRINKIHSILKSRFVLILLSSSLLPHSCSVSVMVWMWVISHMLMCLNIGTQLTTLGNCGDTVWEVEEMSHWRRALGGIA